NLNYPKLNKHWHLSGTRLEPLISLFDGSALLFGLKNKQGRVFFITTDLSDKHTNFHRHALFVPSVLNMMLSSGLGQKLAYSIGTQKISISQKISEGSRLSSQSDSSSFIPGISYDGITINNMVRNAGFFDLKNNS